MNLQAVRTVSDEEIVSSLISRLGAIEALERSVSEYSSTFTIENMSVEMRDGRRLGLVFKDMSADAVLEVAKGKRPSFLDEPMREIRVYEEILSRREELHTPDFYASVSDPSRDRYWLFIERIEGLQLSHVGEFEVWAKTARWLAHLHNVPTQSAILIHYDRLHFDKWLVRSRQFLIESKQNSEEIEELLSAYAKATDLLVREPPVFVHGELYSSNVIVENPIDKPLPRVVDWEMAGLGPGVIDVAALISGGWSDFQRKQLIEAYLDEMILLGMADKSIDDLERAILASELHLALRWLCWAPDWQPPKEHSQDWWKRAWEAARRLQR